MENNKNAIIKNSEKRMNISKFFNARKGSVYLVLGLAVLCTIWHFAAKAIDRSIILPDFVSTMRIFISNWTDPYILSNLSITLVRVSKGFLYSVIIGLPIGLLMGFSKTTMEAISPVMNSIRQIPIMAWVPLSIIWFGLGDGPTVFLITMAAVFPIIINTMAGVKGIDPNFKFAARSMGANTAKVLRDIIFPGALPGILTGCRIAIGMGWMLVICAEFIATSEGFGFLLVESQRRIQTPQLFSYMIMAALVGFAIDRLLQLLEKNLTSWRYKDAAIKN